MRASRMGAVNLSQGLPEPMNDAKAWCFLHDAKGSGWQYADPSGIPELRAAIAREYGAMFSPENVLVTSGCTEALLVALLGLAARGRRSVGFLEPFYPYYLGLAELAGMEALPIQMSWVGNTARPDWERVEGAMRAGMQILLLNTPHNPTGWVLSNSDARHLCTLAVRHGVFVLLDEAYKAFIYEPSVRQGVEVLYELRELCATAGSATKTFSLPGMRIGWLLGDAALLTRARAIHMLNSYCQPAPLQTVITRFLEQDDASSSANSVCAHYSSKRDLLTGALQRVGLQAAVPTGGHFVLADYSAVSPEPSAQLFAQTFASLYGVMPLPVEPFYASACAPRQLRFSFCPSLESVATAVRRLEQSRSAS